VYCFGRQTVCAVRLCMGSTLYVLSHDIDILCKGVWWLVIHYSMCILKTNKSSIEWWVVFWFFFFKECSNFGAEGFFRKHRPFFKQAVPWKWPYLSIQGKQKHRLWCGWGVSLCSYKVVWLTALGYRFVWFYRGVYCEAALELFPSWGVRGGSDL